MRTIYYRLQATLLHLLFFAAISAQSPEKAIDSMSWRELTDKGESLALLGNNNAALLYARAALEKARQDSSEASLDYGNSLDFLGYALHHTGQHAEAERCFLAAVAHARVHLGENHEDYITRLSNLAMLHISMGELAKAASELESAVHLGEKNLAADNPYLGIMINNLGLAYEMMGNLESALEYYLRALDLTERTAGRESTRYAIRLQNISAIFRKTGRSEQALDFSLRALKIFEKTVGKSHPDYASGLNGVMQSYTELSRYAEAIPLSEELLALIEKMAAKESPETYDYNAAVANLYFQAGQYARSAEFSRAALLKYREIFPRLYTKHAYMARLAMISFEKMGNLPEAADLALQLNRFSLDELHENSSKFSEDEQLQNYHAYRQGTDISPLLFAVRHPGLPGLAVAAYDYELTVKGLSLANRRQLFQSLRENPGAQLATQFEEWQRLQSDISRQYALNPARRPTNLDSLLARSNELERSLVQASEPFRLASQATGWQDVQAALAPGEAAVEFGQLKDAATDSILYAAWVIRPGDLQPKQVFLFEEKDVGNLAATRRLYSPTSSPEGKTWHELLWQPLEPFLQGVSNLYFAPAGILHEINFGAVPVSATEVVADRISLHRLVSTRQIASLKKTPVQFPVTSALVFGGIRYETDSLALAATNTTPADETSPPPISRNRGFAAGDHWDYLAGSSEEAAAVCHRLTSIGAKVTLAGGFEASEGFFKKSLRNPPAPTLLHLATHGFFLTAPEPNARSGFAAAENPMVRAGLVLSGANRAWGGGEPLAGQEDGILTALEISRLDLSGTALVVLSACGTGQGKVEAGEGVLGLQRAFKMAGARYVIMTLWNVQDHHARQFMDFFYDGWLSQKQSVPQAFRAAQLKMRRLYAKPFQPMAWAGFILLE